MDNLTHSLIGAALGQAGLKRRTGLAMPALILAANLPDIDAPCAVYGVASLSMRRGITHGPIALAVLPLILAALLWWFDAWQARRGTRPAGRIPVHFGWLLALCYLGTFTHPLFDWFNNSGIRLLEPFSSRWFYGDTLFIIDPWILALLGWGTWASLRRERAGKANWFAPARAALTGLAGYVLANSAISQLAVAQAAGDVPDAGVNVANAVPLAFWRREVLLRTGDGRHGRIDCTPWGCDRGPPDLQPTNMADPRIREWAKGNRAAQAFLFWSRMPVAELHPDRIVLSDQRFRHSPARNNFTVTIRHH